MPTLLTSYSSVQEKWGLPHLEKLKSVFKIEVDPECDIDEVRDELSDRLFGFTERVIEPLIWSHHTCQSIEREMLDKKTFQKLFELYKEIQALRWQNNLLTIRPNPDGTVNWIRNFWAFWGRFEELASSICITFERGWRTLRFADVMPADYNG